MADLKLDTERLREAMERKGLNSAQLADATGLTRSSISYFLHGKRQPGRLALAEFADKLSVTVDYLLGVSDGPDIAELLKNPRIVKLVMMFQELPVKEQERVLEMVRLMMETTEQIVTASPIERK